MWLIWVVVCLLSANCGTNCSLTRALLVYYCIISSCQSSGTSEIAKCFWSRLMKVALQQVLDLPLPLADFYARKQLLLSAHLSHRNSVRLSVHPSVTRVDQAKSVQDRISKSSPSAAWKTLVSGTVKLFHKFEGGHLERGP